MSNRTYGGPLPDEKFPALMNALFNVWFRKWKNIRADEEYDAAAVELNRIMEQGDQYPAVKHLCISLLYELEARMHGGYTKTGRDKLLAIIQRETE